MSFPRPVQAVIVLALVAFAVLLSEPSCAAENDVPPAVATAVKDPARPQMDMWRDKARHPAEVVAFTGAKAGDNVADLVPGDGYYTRIFSALVGPKGHVYPVVNLAGFRDARLKREDETKNHRDDPVDLVLPIQFVAGYENVQVIWENIARDRGVELPEQLDLVFTADGYHAMHNKAYGPLHLDVVNASLFLDLKPGGTYVVIDHASAPGKGFSQTESLERSDPKAVKAEILAAGFVYDGSSDVLAHPADDHMLSADSPSLRDKTDQYMLRFKKPMGAGNGNRPKESPYKAWFGKTWVQPGLPSKFHLHIFYHADGTYQELQDRSDRLFAAGKFYTAADGRVCILHQWPFYQNGYIICSKHPLPEPGVNLLPGIVYPPSKIVAPDPEPPYKQP